ncbi:MAG: hypothetical protein ACE5SW_09660 [Nitrososphaeraceae archaeon]
MRFPVALASKNAAPYVIFTLFITFHIPLKSQLALPFSMEEKNVLPITEFVLSSLGIA